MRVVGPLWLLAAIAAVVVGVGGLWRGYDIGFGSVAIVFVALAFGPVFWIVLVIWLLGGIKSR